ncbi:uncharacterized protein LOC141696369 [Apium graveolens]|uniref:uncharacterized protein LOC141696369 n=1 Tax=Apium graveolens TaxID=4045 RepID=UPI003D7A0140
MFTTRPYKKTKLEAWFDANQTFPNARNYSYSEFPNKFTWHPRPGIWKERKRGDVIGRLSEVHSSSGELLYLHMLLLRKKGSRSFEDLKTVNGHIHETFKEAYAALGLLQNDNQWHEAIAENSHTSLPPQLRAIFVNILAYSPISDPLRLWEANWQYEDLKNYVLAEIEKLFNDIGKSLKDYATMPFPSEVYFSNAVNRLLQEETSYDKEELKILHEKNHGMLNPEQKNVYDSIIQNIYNKVGGVFFVYGSGGCEGKIVLHVASYGITVVLLPGGRTAYSRFHIPLKLYQDSTAGIRHGTDIAELIQQTDLIIWDEAPIQHRHAFESVDRSLRDIMSAIDKRRAKKPFGGITVVFGGDYR